MKRRDALRLIPLSAVGLSSFPLNAFSRELYQKNTYGKHSEPLSLQYIGKVMERLTWIRENQTENLMEAAYAIARTVQNGGSCWQSGWDSGHTQADSWPDRNGEPDIFKSGFNRKEAKAGDILLTGSSKGSQGFIDYIKEKNIFLISRTSPWSGDARQRELLSDDVQKLSLRLHADIWVETNATSLGGVIQVPGMPAPIGPVSAVVGKVTIWMMLADACRILARRGVNVPVKGDEPIVNSEKVNWKSFSGWEDLNKPLMDDYFDEVTKQIGMIGSELGKIRKIAGMALDTVLSGGKIWCYSRYSSIAGEANTRRSGLSITTGISDFKGKPKDCVIMGITKPDDDVDLEFLKKFKKIGMKTASIGPMTRSIKVQEGKTVPRQTDIHAGRMGETYGLFAIPGMEKRICPTSGVILNQLFWAMIMEFVEQYIDRTGGDIPGVFFSAALKGGREHMHRMHELFKGNEIGK